MGKYRGKDGWLHDDNVAGPQRYKRSENVQQSKPKKRDTCPNCLMGAVSWLREEGYCTHCGWGKPKKDSGACCLALAIFIILPLLGMGMGYGIGGFGGLLVGLAIGLALPLVVWHGV